MTSNEVSELVKFLHEDQNDMMRLNAVNIVAELTASNDGFKLVTAENDERIIDAVVRSLKDSYDAVAGLEVMLKLYSRGLHWVIKHFF